MTAIDRSFLGVPVINFGEAHDGFYCDGVDWPAHRGDALQAGCPGCELLAEIRWTKPAKKQPKGKRR